MIPFEIQAFYIKVKPTIHKKFISRAEKEDKKKGGEKADKKRENKQFNSSSSSSASNKANNNNNKKDHMNVVIKKSEMKESGIGSQIEHKSKMFAWQIWHYIKGICMYNIISR